MKIDEYKKEIDDAKKIINSIKTLKYDSISIYGSAYNDKTFVDGFSDIDMIIMCANFNELNLDNIVKEIRSKNINFREKEPTIIRDNLCERIEFYIQFERVSLDITICGGLIPSKKELLKSAWYDSFEALIGGVYIYSKTIYGKIPDYDLFKKEYYPFYNDEIRNARLQIICKKLKSYNKKIEYNYNEKNYEAIDNVIKARKFFIKLLFIYYKKYYWTPEKHVYYQLDNYLNLDKEFKEKLSFAKGNMFKCINDYLQISNSFIEKIEKELK